MSDYLTVRGLIATQPRHTITAEGLNVLSFRLVSASRKFDSESGQWQDDKVNWFTISAFRKLAENSNQMLSKGDRVMVFGKLRIRDWDNGERSGTSVEIEADAIGQDLTFAISEDRSVLDYEEDSEAELQPA